jgi:secondary thiamine-phosphate synthase enzyme
MRQAHGRLTIATRGAGLVEVTDEVTAWLDAQEIADGLLTVFCRHTSASLLVNENAAPAVRRDLERYFQRLAPESRDYEHDDEGPDDMPAHLRTALTNVSIGIPVHDGRMMLGTWQGLYLFEHRAAPHRRTLALHVIGE